MAKEVRKFKGDELTKQENSDMSASCEFSVPNMAADADDDEIIFLGRAALSSQQLVALVENTVTTCCNLVSKLTGKTLPAQDYVPTAKNIESVNNHLYFVSEGECKGPDFRYRGQYLFVKTDLHSIVFPLSSDQNGQVLPRQYHETDDVTVPGCKLPGRDTELDWLCTGVEKEHAYASTAERKSQTVQEVRVKTEPVLSDGVNDDVMLSDGVLGNESEAMETGGLASYASGIGDDSGVRYNGVGVDSPADMDFGFRVKTEPCDPWDKCLAHDDDDDMNENVFTSKLRQPESRNEGLDVPVSTEPEVDSTKGTSGTSKKRRGWQEPRVRGDISYGLRTNITKPVRDEVEPIWVSKGKKILPTVKSEVMNRIENALETSNCDRSVEGAHEGTICTQDEVPKEKFRPGKAPNGKTANRTGLEYYRTALPEAAEVTPDKRFFKPSRQRLCFCCRQYLGYRNEKYLGETDRYVFRRDGYTGPTVRELLMSIYPPQQMFPERFYLCIACMRYVKQLNTSNCNVEKAKSKIFKLLQPVVSTAASSQEDDDGPQEARKKMKTEQLPPLYSQPAVLVVPPSLVSQVVMVPPVPMDVERQAEEAEKPKLDKTLTKEEEEYIARNVPYTKVTPRAKAIRYLQKSRYKDAISQLCQVKIAKKALLKQIQKFGRLEAKEFATKIASMDKKDLPEVSGEAIRNYNWRKIIRLMIEIMPYNSTCLIRVCGFNPDTFLNDMKKKKPAKDMGRVLAFAVLSILHRRFPATIKSMQETVGAMLWINECHLTVFKHLRWLGVTCGMQTILAKFKKREKERLENLAQGLVEENHAAVK